MATRCGHSHLLTSPRVPLMNIDLKFSHFFLLTTPVSL